MRDIYDSSLGRNSSHPRIFFADFLFVASAKLAHQEMQSVDNIFEQALPTVIGVPSMPLSSMAMAMAAIFWRSPCRSMRQR
ncbi:MAG: hypothetical protein WAK90_23350 [Pseudolabrys sp.]